jgi:uncharacterized protein (TIGR02246 family)
MTKRGFSLMPLLVFVCSFGCGGGGVVHLSGSPAAEEAAIRKADANWLAAAQARDLERILPFWADDAIIIPSAEPAIAGKDAIRQYVAGAFGSPGFSISWQTDKIEVAGSGDLAYSTGTNQITFNNAEGKTMVANNRAVVVWKKNSDGSWKCIVDMMSPAPAKAK